MTGRAARLYDRWAGRWQAGIARLGYPGAYADLMARALAPKDAPARLLDVGAGTGAMTRAALERLAPARRAAASVELLDPSAEMLGEAERLLGDLPSGLALRRGGVGDAGVPEGAYDVVLCAHVIEHLAEPEAAVDWMLRRLAPGGRLALVVSRPHWCTTLVRWRWRHRAFAPREVRAMLDRAGAAEIVEQGFERGPPSRMSRGYLARRPASV